MYKCLCDWGYQVRERRGVSAPYKSSFLRGLSLGESILALGESHGAAAGQYKKQSEHLKGTQHFMCDMSDASIFHNSRLGQ